MTRHFLQSRVGGAQTTFTMYAFLYYLLHPFILTKFLLHLIEDPVSNHLIWTTMLEQVHLPSDMRTIKNSYVDYDLESPNKKVFQRKKYLLDEINR